MVLYTGLSIWITLVLLMGLRPDSIEAAECWPNQPEDSVVRINKLIISVFVWSTLLALWFLTAFRSAAIGNDTRNYLWYFSHFAQGLDNTSKLEIGYQYLNYFLGKVTRDQHNFLIIMATIMYGGFGVFLRKYSKNPAVSLCLFFSCFFSVYTNIFRQGIAMIIALYGYQLLKDGKRILAAALFLLATTFHTTAFLCFLLFLDLKALRKWWIVLGVTGVCAIVSLTGVMKAVVNAVFPRYTHYFEGQYASSGWLAITFYLIVYAIMYLLIINSLEEDNRADGVIATNFTLMMILTAFGYAVNLFERAGEYFMLVAVIELPNILYRGKIKNFRLWLFGICMVLLAFFIVTLIYRPGWNHLYPYEFWH